MQDDTQTSQAMTGEQRQAISERMRRHWASQRESRQRTVRWLTRHLLPPLFHRSQCAAHENAA